MSGKIFLAFSVFFMVFTATEFETIPWRENTKLRWNHFRGKPAKNISAAAVTASGITFEFSIQETESHVVGFNSKVFAHFYPNQSWYVKELCNAHILAHEQLHFDITELYARKFRNQISELKLSNTIRNQLQSLHENINKELAATQRRYDKETDNSKNPKMQSQWAAYVEKELAKREAYKSKD
ncbi:MAG TPA: DUF922 domain-containing protein [Aquaticitalea sp.]|nr:DUF922 domain-containing protein [Aquaticitalea sp.]